jgi:hypothetical protein
MLPCYFTGTRTQEDYIKKYFVWVECVVDWIRLSQDSDKWWVYVNTVMNIRVE